AHQLTASGQYRGGTPLHPPSTATSVRVRDGKRLVTDGPFAETHEQLGGYMLIEVTDRDEAIAIAARGAVARVGPVEVRPVREGLPTSRPRGPSRTAGTGRDRRSWQGGPSGGAGSCPRRADGAPIAVLASRAGRIARGRTAPWRSCLPLIGPRTDVWAMGTL